MEVKGKPITIKATSKTTIKVNDNFYSIESVEERSIPDTEVDMDLEWKDLYNSVNTITDNQIAEILNTFAK